MIAKRLFILSGLSLIISGILYAVIVGIKNIEIDNFRPAAVIFMIDSSNSNQDNIEPQKNFIKSFCKTLDPEDKIKIIQFSKDAYLIYEGSPQNFSAIRKSLNSYTNQEKNNKNNSLKQQDVMKKAVSYSLEMQKNAYIPVIIILSDLEDKIADSKQINWNTLPKNIQKTKKYIPDLTISFLWAHPAKLDYVKEKLNPVLGESHLIISTEETIDKVPSKIFKAIGR